MSSAHGPEDVKKEVRTYMMVFGALLVLTIITVAVSYVDLAIPAAVLVALAIATFKGGLVASFFMHLIHEKRLIFWVLILTIMFFVFLLFIPMMTSLDRITLAGQ
jgi:cytochrome c oxidase subunit 4